MVNDPVLMELHLTAMVQFFHATNNEKVYLLSNVAYKTLLNWVWKVDHLSGSWSFKYSYIIVI